MATRASQYEPASTAAASTSNLAKKPAVNGTPAWASRNTVKASASSGWRAGQAPVVGEGVAAVAPAARRR